MPLYDYDCAACGHRVEVMHGVHADGPAVCPNCGSDRLRKAIAAPAIHFKGSGWAKKERRATLTPGSNRKGSEAADGSDGASGGEAAERSKDDGGSSKDDGGSSKGDGGSSKGDGGSSKPEAPPTTTTPSTTPPSAGAATGSD